MLPHIHLMMIVLTHAKGPCLLIFVNDNPSESWPSERLRQMTFNKSEDI